jgi:hypothetical protein
MQVPKPLEAIFENLCRISHAFPNNFDLIESTVFPRHDIDVCLGGRPVCQSRHLAEVFLVGYVLPSGGILCDRQHATANHKPGGMIRLP